MLFRISRFVLLILILLLSGLVSGAEADVAFTVLEDGLWTVHWASSPETQPRPVRDNLGVDGSAPALSPDGSRIAFELSGQGILVCDLHAKTRCTTVEAGLGSSARPVWDPRSQELVFARYVADATGEESELLITRDGLQGVGPLVLQTGNQDDPDLSPDGLTLVYSSAQTVSLHRAGVQVIRHLWRMILATGAAQPLAPGPYQDMHPDWSPDGSRIAFASDRSGQFEIWVMNSDGEDLTAVTSGPGAKTWPAWSPDGRSLMYNLAIDGKQEIWRTDVGPMGGSNPRRYRPFGENDARPMRDPDWR